MTISTENRIAGPYAGTGLVSTYSFSFKVFSVSDLVITKTVSGIDSDLVYGSDYTVSLNADQDSNPGGTITYCIAAVPTVLPVGTNLTITTSIPYTQTTQLTNGGGWYPKVVEYALDRLVAIVQQLKSIADRTLRLPITVTGVSTELPIPVADAVISWNSDGTSLQNVDTATLATVVAFGTAKADVFSGDGTTTAFTLSANPGAQANLDVAISGVSQRPGIDFTWASGTTLTFASAPVVGSNNVLVRYMQGLPQGTTDSSASTFVQAGTGAVSTSVQTVLRREVNISDFGAAGNGTTDDLVPLTNFINSAIANPGVPHRLNHATYATSGALPPINVSGVKIYGSGPSSNHDIGSIVGSCIKKIGAAGGTLLTVAPTDGAGNQRLDGIEIEGVAFNGNQLAAKGLLIKSVRNSVFRCYAEECTTSDFELDVVTTLGEAKDLQDCTFRLFGRDTTAGGVVLRLLGTSAANVSLNRFEVVDVVHKNQTGIVCQNPDNNFWGLVRVYRQAGGVAANSIEWQGGASTSLCTRFEVFDKLTCTVAPIAKGTGTYTVAAHDIFIRNLDTENGSPAPTVETGATVAGPAQSWTPTVSASSGTITSSSATAKYWLDTQDSKIVNFRIAITMTNNGTGAGVLRATLPFTSANDNIAGVFAGYEGATGKQVRGIVNTNASSLEMVFYDTTYPGATGNVVTVSGSYRRA